ncbi:hypothetical protein ACE38W_03640 [Chitinophaga sp. Hz27]|uniref:hypothetical protein n=1 Tax=Chitinophaga sp. Hz27 TaxID=3347169 RepID=UPI0035DAE780
MYRFEKDMRHDGFRETIITILGGIFILVFSALAIALDLAGLIVVIPAVLILAYTWLDYYHRMCVVLIEINEGKLTVSRKNRVGKQNKVSCAIAELQFVHGYTNEKNPRNTFSLTGGEPRYFFSHNTFMRVVDGKDGWKLTDFIMLEKVFMDEGMAGRTY